MADEENNDLAKHIADRALRSLTDPDVVRCANELIRIMNRTQLTPAQSLGVVTIFCESGARRGFPKVNDPLMWLDAVYLAVTSIIVTDLDRSAS